MGQYETVGVEDLASLPHLGMVLEHEGDMKHESAPTLWIYTTTGACMVDGWYRVLWGVLFSSQQACPLAIATAGLDRSERVSASKVPSWEFSVSNLNSWQSWDIQQATWDTHVAHIHSLMEMPEESIRPIQIQAAWPPANTHSRPPRRCRNRRSADFATYAWRPPPCWTPAPLPPIQTETRSLSPRVAFPPQLATTQQ